MRRHLLVLIVVFVVLVGSDLFIATISHYNGSTDDDLTTTNFLTYIQETKNQDELLLLFIFAIAITIFINRLFKLG